MSTHDEPVTSLIGSLGSTNGPVLEAGVSPEDATDPGVEAAARPLPRGIDHLEVQGAHDVGDLHQVVGQ
jgi:hypothetical protein